MKSILLHACKVSDSIVIARDLRQNVNQYDANKTHVLLPGSHRGCIEIFKMAEDGHESHVLFLLLLFFMLRIFLMV